jgi:hypothetical protein
MYRSSGGVGWKRLVENGRAGEERKIERESDQARRDRERRRSVLWSLCDHCVITVGLWRKDRKETKKERERERERERAQREEHGNKGIAGDARLVYSKAQCSRSSRMPGASARERQTRKRIGVRWVGEADKQGLSVSKSQSARAQEVSCAHNHNSTCNKKLCKHS